MIGIGIFLVQALSQAVSVFTNSLDFSDARNSGYVAALPL